MAVQQRGEETRGRILEAAAVCLATHGYDATGVSEICQRAGVSKGAFYHHFASKQALFLALLDQWLDRLEVLLAARRVPGATAPEQLESLADLLPQVFDEAQAQLPILLEFWAQAVREPAVWQAAIAPYRRFRDYFATLISDGIAEGSLRSVHPETGAGVVLSLLVGLLLQGVMDPEGADWGQVGQDGVRLLLSGLGNVSTLPVEVSASPQSAAPADRAILRRQLHEDTADWRVW